LYKQQVFRSPVGRNGLAGLFVVPGAVELGSGRLEGERVTGPEGLTREEAAARLHAEGHNELPASGARGLLAIVLEVVREPMFLLLVFAGVLYAVLGDLQEAAMLLAFVFVVMGITVYQERKTERALEALRDLSSPRALVVRGGAQERIAGRDVVRGDIVLVTEGDRVPADAVLLTCNDLSVDESLLTGESVPVRKMPCSGPVTLAIAGTRPGGDDLPNIYSGTLVLQGQGIAEVVATGVHTEIGRIGLALERAEVEPTVVQRQSRFLVRNMAIVGLSVCALVVLVYGLTRGHWINGLLAGVTLAMATLPEEIPVVLTVFLALGAWRIGQKGVLTRRIPAVEALGSATALCVDKTGTLTMNSMTVARLYAGGQWFDTQADGETERQVPAAPSAPGQLDGGLPVHAGPLEAPSHEVFHPLVEYGILASELDPFDPMEKAFTELGDRYFRGTDHLHADWQLVHEYSLSRDLLAMSHVWQSPRRDAYVIASKGAPEAIASLCHLAEARRLELVERVGEMADEGLRVLGVARALYEGAEWPGGQHDFDFEFVGLVGLADPPRESVRESLLECRTAGIRVIMITGDYPGTAKAVARRIGLEPADKALTGAELDAMNDAQLRECIAKCNIFARVVPEQKLRLVEAFKARGELVAMTGDGVNDAPALKAANIGVAMGKRGTDVAREAASLVLLDDDFSSIVAAVRLGRRIFDNLKKAVAYIFAVHVPIIGLTLLPLLFRWPLVFAPVHVVFLELIIDPACSVVFEAEPEERDVMTRPPRDPAEPLYGRRILGLSILQGLVVMTILLAIYGIALEIGRGVDEARALTFTALVVANLSLILTNRSWSRSMAATIRVKNAALWWVLGGASLFLFLVLYVPVLRRVFGFGVLHPFDLLLAVAAGIVSVLWFEVFKLRSARERKAPAQG
jgi:P-type Ca2+ transporter type 2C